MTDNALIELAVRCEAAEGPDRELDHAIATALGWREVPNPTFAGGVAGRWYRADGTMTDHYGVPGFTASLDAAMTLVPEGWAWALWESGAYAVVSPNNEDEGNASSGDGANPALALCAAALRARSAA